jgi:thiopurine S-methyltransferase
MDKDFWLARWSKGEIGFNQTVPHAVLQKVRARLGTRVYVPLCGKSVDMIYLAEHGHQVYGTEIATDAIDAFFIENQLPRRATATRAPFVCHASDRIEILEGDAFELTPEHLGKPVTSIYDRAALVAVKPPDRARLVRTYERLLRLGGDILLVAVDYPQDKVSGPPWALAPSDIADLFAGFSSVQLLHVTEARTGPKFRNAGLESTVERSYWISR